MRKRSGRSRASGAEDARHFDGEMLAALWIPLLALGCWRPSAGLGWLTAAQRFAEHFDDRDARARDLASPLLPSISARAGRHSGMRLVIMHRELGADCAKCGFRTRGEDGAWGSLPRGAAI